MRDLVLKKTYKKIKVSDEKKKLFLKYEKESPNYFLNYKTIYNILKYNFSLLIKFFLYEQKK